MTAPRWLPPFARWLALAFVLGFVPTVHANMGAPTDPGQTHGPLVLRNVSEVRVDREELAFEVGRSLRQAQVRATYHLTNGLAGGRRLAIEHGVSAPGLAYVARLPAAPKGELGFTVMSLSKVLLGVEDPNAYWALLVLLTSLVVIALSELVGRVWARVRWRVLRAALHALVSSSLAFGASFGMWLLAMKTLPRFALGPNYNPMFGLLFMSIAMVLASIGLSARASGAAQRRSVGARDPSR